MSDQSPNSRFRTTQRLKVQYSPHNITEYVSNRTGMRVVVVDQAGPKVQGFFAAATEVLDDSGSPHTLEHLCFMGSKSYPYKGLLDRLATRGYSNTNAWTSTDHTAYTLDTAGYASFAQILPVYLDHVVRPTLTDAGCYTEVFHIDGTGHDAGVVYSEMQGVQNTPSELMELRSKRILYPEGVGFRYETGGMMENLRVLTPERIRKFHRHMYQPKNLAVIIVGQVDHTHLLQTLDDFEATIMTDIPKPDAPFSRPWVDSKQPPPLSESVKETVEFPEEDESIGEISIKYFGPSCNDVVQYTALSVLLAYLTSSSASVLENILVEKEQLASAVYYLSTPRPKSVTEFILSGVDALELAKVEARFMEILQETASKELDMTYLTDCLNREKRQQLFMAESSDDFFTTAIISTFLFSETRSMEYLTHMKEYEELASWTERRWRDFLKKWFVDMPHVTILGRPSNEKSKRLKEEEEARVDAQKKRLGEAGMKELEKKLEEAKAENDKPFPKELLEQFKIPGTDTIHFISTVPARSRAARKAGPFDNRIQHLVDEDKSENPLYIHYEHVPSNFVTICLIICTSSIPVSLRPMLLVYMENFFNSPVLRDGKRVEFEDVVKALERDTVDYKIRSASVLGNPEVLSISMGVEAEKYEVAIQWVKDLLWNGIFDLERIGSTTSRLLSDVPEEKRSGDGMVYSTALMIHESPESISKARDTLVKGPFLKRTKQLLQSDPDTVLGQLEEIKKALCQPSDYRVLVIANVEKLDKPVSSWDILTKGQDHSKPLSPLDARYDRLTDAGTNPGNLSYIIPLPPIDSSFALSVAKGPIEHRDPRVPVLMVAVAYLDAVEGPLWTGVRGTGLAYGMGFRRRIGQIEFSIYRSPNAYKAFATSRKVVEGFVTGETAFDTLALEGAISSIILSLASSQATMGQAAADNFVKQVIKDLPRDWNDIILDKVRNVTVDEIKATMKDVLLPAFQPETSNLFVTCAPIMQENLVKGFSSMGFKPEVKPLAFFQDNYGLHATDGDDQDEDDGVDSISGD